MHAACVMKDDPVSFPRNGRIRLSIDEANKLDELIKKVSSISAVVQKVAQRTIVARMDIFSSMDSQDRITCERDGCLPQFTKLSGGNSSFGVFEKSGLY